MSSWPWMQGAGVAVRNPPIPPVNDHDQRPSVADLIAKHRDNIDKLREKIVDATDLFGRYYDPTKHDDLWLLRFLMSHKFKIKPCLDAIHTTLELRDKYKLDHEDIRGKQISSNFIRHHPCSGDRMTEAIQNYFEYVTDDFVRFSVPDPQRGVVVFISTSELDQHGIVQNVSEEDWVPTFLLFAEWTFQWVDYVTRTTGRLTKSIRFGDVENMSLSKLEMENQKRDGRAMSVMEDCYPQLLQSIYICHAPRWIQIPWRVVRILMPKRVTEKIDFINPAHSKKERKRLYAHIAPHDLPTRYGGENCSWPVEFPIPLVPNLTTSRTKRTVEIANSSSLPN